MKVLVSGGAGYIGSHTAHQLVEAGHKVLVLDNLYSGHAWAVPSEAKFIKGDVGDRALVEKILAEEAVDAVIHFAAHIEVGESVENPAKYYRNNTVSALSFFDACAQGGVKKIIFSSTAAVYGEPAVTVLKETEPLQPASPYGASKAMTERILTDIAAASGGKLSYVILRYFNVAGARLDGTIGQATPRATHLIKIASLAAVGSRKGMNIFGSDYPTPDGTCVRDYIHVEDLAKAHLDALSYLHQGGASDVFNVGYGRGYSVREVIDTMKRVSGVDFTVTEGPRRAGDVSTLIADNSKIRERLGWTPRFDKLDLICETALNWEKSDRARQALA